MSILRPIVLSGGEGARLWPLSTPDRPKQFVRLFEGTSLFEMTLTRAAAVTDLTPWIVTGARHKAIVDRFVGDARVAARLILEPTGRNTAPAAAAAALLAKPDEVLFIMPADSYITDVGTFRASVENALGLAEEGRIVALGVVPTRPETGYGYIETGESLDGGFGIASFIEKPDLSKAEQLLASGSLWNAGMFIAKAAVLREQFELHAARVLDRVAGALPAPSEGDVVVLADTFSEVESISIDHAIMEKTGSGAVVPLDAGWSDVGSYRALLEVLPRDAAGNHIVGRVEALDVVDSLLISADRKLAVSGVNGQAIVETEEAVLVVDLEQSQTVKKLAGSD